MAAMIFTTVLLKLCSCSMADSYKEFSIAKITGHDLNYYVSADETDFARVGDVAIIPEIKEIRHGVYMIYISACSVSKPESVVIRKLDVTVDNETVLEYEKLQQVRLELNQNNMHVGTIEGGTFTEEDIKLVDGKKLDLYVNVQVAESGQTISKQIVFQIKLKIYKSLVAPT